MMKPIMRNPEDFNTIVVGPCMIAPLIEVIPERDRRAERYAGINRQTSLRFVGFQKSWSIDNTARMIQIAYGHASTD